MAAFLIKLILLSTATAVAIKFFYASLSLSIVFLIAFLSWFLIGLLVSAFSSDSATYEETSGRRSIAQCFFSGLFWGLMIGLSLLGVIAIEPVASPCFQKAIQYFSAIPISNYLASYPAWAILAIFIGWWMIVIGVLFVLLNNRYVGPLFGAALLIGLAYSHYQMPEDTEHKLKTALNSVQQNFTKSVTNTVPPMDPPKTD